MLFFADPERIFYGILCDMKFKLVMYKGLTYKL